MNEYEIGAGELASLGSKCHKLSAISKWSSFMTLTSAPQIFVECAEGLSDKSQHRGRF